ncbi:phage head closure protein [Fibrisoma limi]|nr:phage head closure protein [Fibrisoma limi]
MKKKLQSGDLDRTAHFYHQQTLKDNGGDYLNALDNDPYASVPAARLSSRGDEKELLNRPTEVGVETFAIRYRDDVRATDQMKIDGVVYNVTFVTEGEGRRQWTLITAKRKD